MPRQYKTLPDDTMCYVILTGSPGFIESLYIGSACLKLTPDEDRVCESEVSLGALRAKEPLRIMLITRRPDGTGTIDSGIKVRDI